MPFYQEGQTVGFSQFLETEVEEYGEDIVLTSVGRNADTYGNKFVYPGTVIAKITGSQFSTYNQGIVKVSAPTYGPGSNVARGLLRSFADVTNGPRVVHLVCAGRVKTVYVTDQGTTGTVQAATKTALSRIEWV